MTRTAAVVGGGIGGLAAAIGLRQRGWDVTVFERAHGLPATGTGLGIWPRALRGLDRLGLGERARRAGRPQATGAIKRPDGRRIAVLDMDRLRRRQGEPVYLLSRPALLGLLHDALPERVVRFGSPVGDPLRLRADHDLVVGADGINSAVRGAVFGDRHGLRYAGMTVWRGVADLDTEVGGETWGRGAKFGITPQGPGRTNWYAVLRAPENHRSGLADVDELRLHFGDWHDPVPAILDRYGSSDVVRHDIRYLDPPLPSFVDGDVALLGDAAHAMAPDLGQGACQALLDGIVLAECVAGADLSAGLREFDRLRRRPTQRMAAMALRASRLSQVKRCTGLRDAALKVALSFGPPS